MHRRLNILDWIFCDWILRISFDAIEVDCGLHARTHTCEVSISFLYRTINLDIAATRWVVY